MINCYLYCCDVINKFVVTTCFPFVLFYSNFQFKATFNNFNDKLLIVTFNIQEIHGLFFSIASHIEIEYFFLKNLGYLILSRQLRNICLEILLFLGSNIHFDEVDFSI